MRDLTNLTLGGEPVRELIDGLSMIDLKVDDDGWASFEATVPQCLVRAIMRYEAALIVADADAMASGEFIDRTPDQRRADAFTQLLTDLLTDGVPDD
jgi:hypothetical protein